MSDEQIAKSPVPILHIPTVMGAVVVTYNLEGVQKGLKITSDILADIFLGKLTQWNDKRIASINPGRETPRDCNMVAHRSDGSGTTAILQTTFRKLALIGTKKLELAQL